MHGAMIGFIIGSFATGLAAYYFAQIFIKARVKEMISEKTEKRLKDQDFNISLLQKKLRIAHTERDMAISHAKNALIARNTFADEIRIKLKGL